MLIAPHVIAKLCAVDKRDAPNRGKCRRVISIHTSYILISCTKKSCYWFSYRRNMATKTFRLMIHYSDVIMGALASQITGVPIVYSTSTVCSGTDQRNIKALRHWPLWGEFPVDREVPVQRASDAENVSIWWRHHVEFRKKCCCKKAEVCAFLPYFSLLDISHIIAVIFDRF